MPARPFAYPGHADAPAALRWSEARGTEVVAPEDSRWSSGTHEPGASR